MRSIFVVRPSKYPNHFYPYIYVLYRGHGSEVYDLAWSPDAHYIASGTMDNTTYVWDTNTCKKVAMWQHHKSYVQGVAWDPKNRLVTTVSSDR